MKAYEFPAKINPEGSLTLPNELVELLPDNNVVRVIILVSEPTDTEEDADWSRLAVEQLLAQYTDDDAIYDRI